MSGCFLPGIVQKKRRDTKRALGVSFPRVHAMVYSVDNGILKELEMDHHQEFMKYLDVYDLMGPADDITGLFDFDDIPGEETLVDPMSAFEADANERLRLDALLAAELGINAEHVHCVGEHCPPADSEHGHSH